MKNKEKLKTLLKKIGFSVRSYNDDLFNYIYNEKGEDTKWFIFGKDETRLELESANKEAVVCFYLDQCKVSLLDKKCVAVTAKNSKNSVFVLFQNKVKNLKIKK